MMTRRRRKAPPRPLVVLLCVALFALGVYLGILFTKPPPRPDLATLDEVAPPVLDARSADAASAEPRPRVESTEAVAVSPSDDSAALSPEPDVAQDETAPDETVPSQTDPAGAASSETAPGASGSATLAIRRQPPPGGSPRVAIIIDDLGRSVDKVARLETLGVPLTYSVLPFETRTGAVVAELRRRGVEYLCHLPMEARGADSGPGSLRASMTSEELRAATEKALAAVPGARGANNHMGSALVDDEAAMRTVLTAIAARDLFFVDSRTSSKTVGYTLARELGIPAAERQVFLDNERDIAKIRAQIRLLVDTARQRGAALAIAHPYAETIEALRAEIPAARAAGVEFVPVSRLLER